MKIRQCFQKLQLKMSGIFLRHTVVPELKNALQLIWPALPEKAIDNSVKDYRKRLQTCVSLSN